MDIKDFEKLAEDIEEWKAKKIKAEANIENILEQLKSNGINSIDDAKKKRDQLMKENDADEEKLAIMSDKIEKMIN
jgi:hypothetical protein